MLHFVEMGAHHLDNFQFEFERLTACSDNGTSIPCPDVQQLKASNPNYTLVDVIQLLVDEGADINAKEPFSEQTALHSFISTYTLLHGGGGYDRNKTSAVLRKLIENGADVNTTDFQQRTPLHTACQQGDNEMVEILLESNPNINAKDRFGRTPLMIAAYRCRYSSDPEIVKLLLEHNADVNQGNNDGWNAILYAMSGNCVENAKLLLEKNLNIYAKDTSGKTMCDKTADTRNVSKDWWSILGCNTFVNWYKKLW